MRGFSLMVVVSVMVALGTMLAVPDMVHATGGRQRIVVRQGFRAPRVQRFRVQQVQPIHVQQFAVQQFAVKPVQRFQRFRQAPVIVTQQLHAPQIQFQQFHQFQGGAFFTSPQPIVVPGGYSEFFIY